MSLQQSRKLSVPCISVIGPPNHTASTCDESLKIRSKRSPVKKKKTQKHPRPKTTMSPMAPEKNKGGEGEGGILKTGGKLRAC